MEETKSLTKNVEYAKELSKFSRYGIMEGSKFRSDLLIV